MSEDTDNTILETVAMFPYPKDATAKEIADVNRKLLGYLIKQFVKLDGRSDIALDLSKKADTWIEEEDKAREENKGDKKENKLLYITIALAVLGPIATILIMKFAGL